jgi:hypothetical protein
MVTFSFLFQLPLHVVSNRCISNSMSKSEWRESRMRSKLSEMIFRTDKHETWRLQIDLMWVPNIQRGLSGKKRGYTAYFHDLWIPHSSYMKWVQMQNAAVWSLTLGQEFPSSEFFSYAFNDMKTGTAENGLGPTSTRIHITHHKKFPNPENQYDPWSRARFKARR